MQTQFEKNANHPRFLDQENIRAGDPHTGFHYQLRIPLYPSIDVVNKGRATSEDHIRDSIDFTEILSSTDRSQKSIRAELEWHILTSAMSGLKGVHLVSTGIDSIDALCHIEFNSKNDLALVHSVRLDAQITEDKHLIYLKELTSVGLKESTDFEEDCLDGLLEGPVTFIDPKSKLKSFPTVSVSFIMGEFGSYKPVNTLALKENKIHSLISRVFKRKL